MPGEGDLPIVEHAHDRRQIESGISGHSAEVEEPQNADEHQDRAEHGIQNEFQSRINFASMAPDADEEVRRDEHHFPENEEEEQIERAENADHAHFQDEEHGEEFLDVFVNAVPRAENSERR